MGVRGCRAGFVDPELLGEAVVRIGDTVLAELGERIAQEVGKQLRPTPEAPQVAATPLPPPCRPPAAPQPPPSRQPTVQPTASRAACWVNNPPRR